MSSSKASDGWSRPASSRYPLIVPSLFARQAWISRGSGEHFQNISLCLFSYGTHAKKRRERTGARRCDVHVLKECHNGNRSRFTKCNLSERPWRRQLSAIRATLPPVQLVCIIKNQCYINLGLSSCGSSSTRRESALASRFGVVNGSFYALYLLDDSILSRVIWY